MNTQEFAEHLRRRTLPQGTTIDMSYGVVRAFVEDEKCTTEICDFEHKNAEEVLAAILSEFGVHVVSVAKEMHALYGTPLECSVPTTEQTKPAR